MTTTKRMQQRMRARYEHATKLEVRADAEKRDGIIGTVQGVAVVYGVIDSFGTRFRRGAFDRTKSERVPAGKVQLYAALDSHLHQYGIRSHIGTVRTLEAVADSEAMSADLFDTEDGERAQRYLRAVTASGGFTGLSVGFYDRDGQVFEEGPLRGYEYTEVELREITVTPMPAVPGTVVTGVRSDAPEDVLRIAFGTLVDALGVEQMRSMLAAHERAGEEQQHDPDDAEAGDTTDAGVRGTPAASDTPDARAQDTPVSQATMEDRLAAVRRSYARMTPTTR